MFAINLFMAMKRDDILWKAALEDLFDDFLYFFYPNADELFDMARGFEYLDKELEQLFPPEAAHYATRYVDKLVKVFTHDSNEEWILVHIEVQGYTDQDFARRMFQYYYRILDKYSKPITAFAIFADAHKHYEPDRYERQFLGTSVIYRYNTFKIIAQNDAELEASNNPFALAVLTAKLAIEGKVTNDVQLFDSAYNLAKRLLTKQIPKSKIRNLMNFLRFYIRFENPEIFAKFEQEISNLTNRSRNMGIEEFLLDRAEKQGIEKGLEKGLEQGLEKGLEQGLEKGLEQGREESIKVIALKMRISGLDIALIANITGLSIADIEALDKA